MAKKAKKAPSKAKEQAPVVDPEEELKAFVSDVVDQLVVQASHDLHEINLDKKVVLHCAKQAVQDLISCVNLCFIKHDSGEPEPPATPGDVALASRVGGGDCADPLQVENVVSDEASPSGEIDGQRVVPSESDTASAGSPLNGPVEQAEDDGREAKENDDAQPHADDAQPPTDDVQPHVDDAQTPTDDVQSHVDDAQPPTDDDRTETSPSANSNTSAAEPMQTLTLLEDEDFEPCAIDSWARGAVPHKPKPQNTGVMQLPLSSNVNGTNKKKSADGKSVTRSVRSKVTRVTGQRGGSADSSRSGRKREQQPDVENCIVQLEYDEVLDMGALSGVLASAQASNSPTKREKGRQKSAGEEARLIAIRKIEQRERMEKARKEQLLAELRAEEEAEQKQAKDLKGKEYTFDHEGNVILLNPIHTEKLPPTHYVVSTSVKGSTVENLLNTQENDPEGKFEGAQNPGDAALPKNKRKTSTVQVNHFKPSASFQQQVLKNPSLQVQPGVVIHEAGDTKAGPPRNEDERRMSRRDFVAHQSMLESQSLSGVVNMSDDKASTASGLTQSQHGAEPATGRKSEAFATISENAQLPIDGFPNRRDSVSSAHGNGAAGAREGNGAITQFKAPADNDPNLELLYDPAWGQNASSGAVVPAYVPKKPPGESKKVKLTQGQRKPNAAANLRRNSKDNDRKGRNPRDRPFVETKLSKEKRFLPPPVYPAITGYGMVQGQPGSPVSDYGTPLHSPTGYFGDGKSVRTTDTNQSHSPSMQQVSYETKGFGRSKNDKISIRSDRADRLLGIASLTS